MTDQNNEARDMWAEALSLMFKGDPQEELFRISDDEIDALEGLFTFLVHGYCSLLTVNKLISVLWCWGKPLLLILTRLLIPSFD